MKRLITLLTLALPLAAQNGFDFKTLDKLGANAKNKVNVTLDGDMLKLASSFMGGNSSEEARKLVEGLKGIYIRSFEYPNTGLYNEGDLDPLRSFLQQGKWHRIVESRQDGESSEIYVRPETGGSLGGVAIISTEAKEVTVVFINGSMKPEDIVKLSGNLGIPDVTRKAVPPPGPPPVPKAPNKDED
jgi:hypothetical protein